MSFNPREGPGLASQKKASYLERYGRPQTAPGWHFLTGEQPAIDALTDALGFRYAYDEEIEQYAHGAGDRGADAERAHFEILLRHRVLGTRSPARADRSDARSASARRSTTSCCSATTTTLRRVNTARPCCAWFASGESSTVVAFLSFLTISLAARSPRRERAGPEPRT